MPSGSRDRPKALIVQRCAYVGPSIEGREGLGYTCAMTILQATGDLRKVSLCLGHADMKTTQIYLRADPTEKICAVESVVPLSLRRGCFRAPDKLIAFLMGR